MEATVLDRFIPKRGKRPKKDLTPSSQPILSTDDDVGVAATKDFVAEQLSEIISLIDEESYPALDKSIVLSLPENPPFTSPRELVVRDDPDSAKKRGFWSVAEQAPQPQPNIQYTDPRGINVLTKLSYYSNTRLPPSLPPFRAYISTFPLLCLAALCSANAYHCRQNAVKDEQLISADTRIGTKAMVIKSVTCAQRKIVVIAIRGTSVLSLRDWNINLNTTPQSPAGFLDDEGNYCHSGFLRVARAMVGPVAVHLRHLLEENPTRLSYSLLLTGHSAGGAVASLLYAHMLSEQVTSELTILTDCFKRVHCVTFGAPPVSLLPLRKPASKEHRLQMSLFHAFINEGDPVVRAEKSYVRSLVDLLTSPPPMSSPPLGLSTAAGPTHTLEVKSSSADLALVPTSGFKLAKPVPDTQVIKQKPNSKNPTRAPPLPSRSTTTTTTTTTTARVAWQVPQSTLSNAGRLVVLRRPESQSTASPSTSQADDLTKEFEEVRAFTLTDEQLRAVMFGDPLMHSMDIYRRRIEALAMKAVTGRDEFY